MTSISFSRETTHQMVSEQAASLQALRKRLETIQSLAMSSANNLAMSRCEDIQAKLALDHIMQIVELTK